jgi:hypothetical protein
MRKLFLKNVPSVVEEISTSRRPAPYFRILIYILYKLKNKEKSSEIFGAATTPYKMQAFYWIFMVSVSSSKFKSK